MCKDCGCGGEHTHEGHAHGMDVHVPVLDPNDRLAERNRGFFEAKKLLVINVFSSPGSGKTSLLQKTAEMLRNRVRMGVIVGDLATDHDAERLSRADIPVVQITTGTMCHLDARRREVSVRRGRRYTLRGIPENADATVWQLVTEEGDETINLLKEGGDTLTLLDAKQRILPSVSGFELILKRKND